MKPALLAALALAACGTRDSYLCDNNDQCDIGAGDRCEADHRCTAFDPACGTSRRYTEHSGEVSGECFDDRRMPLDPCAPGQPPAPDTDACAANVCARDASCCTSGWTTACVQLAQVECDIKCDTRIAITAQKNNAAPDLWDLRWTGTQWQARQRVDRATKLVWLAPGVGDSEPRLAGFTPGALAIEGPGTAVQSVALTGRNYNDASSADVDRDGRDTLALTSTDSSGNGFFEIVKLDYAGGTREIETLTTKQVDWGDYDHDGFPDAIAGQGARVSVLANADGPDHFRTLVEPINETLPTNSANTTPGTASVHGARLADVDGDALEDFVVHGYQIRLHLGGTTLISDRLALTIDCDPPAVTATQCDPATAAISADVAPDASGPVMYVALMPRRALYRVTARTANDVTTATYTGLMVPPCVSGGSMMPCPGFQAVVARDLDGDHVMDVVAIDADLGLVTSLSSKNFVSEYTPPLAIGRAFTLVQTSVSGVLKP